MRPPPLNFDHTSRLPACMCPHCGRMVDAASGPKAQPLPGDVTVCIYCAKPSVFDEDRKLRKPTVEEADVLIADKRIAELIRTIKRMPSFKPSQRRDGGKA